MSKIDLSGIDLIILDFDGPINNLMQGKIAATKTLCQLLKIKLSQKALTRIINYIDQIWELKRITDYQRVLKYVLKQLKEQGLIEMNRGQADYFIKNFSFFLITKQSCNTDLIKIIQKIKKQHSKIKICIYSRQTKTDIQIFLKKFRIDISLFDGIYSRGDFDEPKPSIKNLERICEKLKTVPKRTVMIGDNIVVDLMPAKFLGMRTILYSKLVDYYIKSSQDLKSIFKKI